MGEWSVFDGARGSCREVSRLPPSTTFVRSSLRDSSIEVFEVFPGLGFEWRTQSLAIHPKPRPSYPRRTSSRRQYPPGRACLLRRLLEHRALAASRTLAPHRSRPSFRQSCCRCIGCYQRLPTRSLRTSGVDGDEILERSLRRSAERRTSRWQVHSFREQCALGRVRCLYPRCPFLQGVADPGRGLHACQRHSRGLPTISASGVCGARSARTQRPISAADSIAASTQNRHRVFLERASRALTHKPPTSRRVAIT